MGIVTNPVVDDLTDELRRVWDMENDDWCRRVSADDQRAMSTIKQTDTGGYELSSPRRETNPTFLNNKDAALRRSLQLKGRFKKDAEFLRQYTVDVENYITASRTRITKMIASGELGTLFESLVQLRLFFYIRKRLVE